MYLRGERFSLARLHIQLMIHPDRNPIFVNCGPERKWTESIHDRSRNIANIRLSSRNKKKQPHEIVLNQFMILDKSFLNPVCLS